jgi:hypothetical protein
MSEIQLPVPVRIAIEAKLAMVRDLAHKGQIVEAVRSALEVHSTLKDAGIKSAFLSWQIAVGFDLGGAPLRALPFINEALSSDPFSPYFQTSLRTITRNLRHQFLSPPNEDPSSQELYAALLKIGVADETVHAAAVRRFIAERSFADAFHALERLERDSPGSVLLSQLRGELAEAQGRPVPGVVRQ